MGEHGNVEVVLGGGVGGRETKDAGIPGHWGTGWAVSNPETERERGRERHSFLRAALRHPVQAVTWKLCGEGSLSSRSGAELCAHEPRWVERASLGRRARHVPDTQHLLPCNATVPHVVNQMRADIAMAFPSTPEVGRGGSPG